MKIVPPSIRETAFNCPSCGALATQYWYSVFAEANGKDRPIPVIVGKAGASEFDLDKIEDPTMKKRLSEWADKMATGVPFLERKKEGEYVYNHLHNISVSRCFNCKNLAVWIHDRLIYPQRGEAPPANPDLPPEIIRDYEEASAILDLSPRGAAALIRLSIQKLCKHLGQSGKDINTDIGALVASGLDPRVQKALDAVRVIGNHAMHPGEIDLRDDRPTAESLFQLLNLIAEKMISEPKHVDEVYATLPESARIAIQKRDTKTGA